MKLLAATAVLFGVSVLATMAVDSAPPETRALVVLDGRLHHFVEPGLSAYVRAGLAGGRNPATTAVLW